MTHESKPALFRIGGIYRDNDGDVIHLRASHSEHGMEGWYRPDGEGEWEPVTAVYDAEGICRSHHGHPHGAIFDLIPGECDTNGAPLDTFYVSAKTLEPQPEPFVREKLRPRLTWADKTPFDPFRDFQVASDTTVPEPFGGPLTRSPDLEPSSPQVGPAFGSAYLLKV